MFRRSRAWCFTANLPDGSEYVPLSIPWKGPIYIIWQYESGTHLHIQGYAYYENQRVGETVKKQIKNWCGVDAHLEVARGTPAQNRDYCSKEESRVDGPFEFGEIPHAGKRTDLSDCWELYEAEGVTKGMIWYFQNCYHLRAQLRALRVGRCVGLAPSLLIVELIGQYPTQMIMYSAHMARLVNEMAAIDWKPRTKYAPPRVILLYGESGTGKTRYAAEMGAIFCDYDSRYIWGHYKGEKCVCFDEFTGQVPLSTLLKQLDGYKVTVQIPYLGNKPWIPETVFICSNNPPDSWYPTETAVRLTALMRRCTVICEFTFDTTLFKQGVKKAFKKGTAADLPILVPEEGPVAPDPVREQTIEFTPETIPFVTAD